MSDKSIVIVGAGHAAVQLCVALIEAGQGHRVHLIGEECELPYQRPPLSKSFLKKIEEATQHLRDADWFTRAGVDLVLGERVIRIHREARSVTLESGRQLTYGQLVLATGTRARRMAGWPDDAVNVHTLRRAQDARALREALTKTSSVTILGGGFIGLEVASTCVSLGKQVTLLEAGQRLMGRAVSQALSAYVLDHHRSCGMRIELQAVLRDFKFDGKRLVSIRTDQGQHDIDLLLLAIGAQPCSELAEEAGLVCDNGIVVDSSMRTSDPHILAVGDCSRFPWRASSLRLESIQNAHDQAKVAAMTLLTTENKPYVPVPWFWSEQGAIRLQMVGLIDADLAKTVRREGSQPGSFSLFHYSGDKLACVESVNAPADYMISRKILEAGRSPKPQQVVDNKFPLKSLL